MWNSKPFSTDNTCTSAKHIIAYHKKSKNAVSVETKKKISSSIFIPSNMMMMMNDGWWVPMRMCRWSNQTEDVKCDQALVYLGVQSKLLRASYCLVLATCRRCAKKPVSRATEEWPLNEWKMGSGLAYPLSGTSLILPWRYFSRVNACCNRLIILSDLPATMQSTLCHPEAWAHALC